MVWGFSVWFFFKKAVGNCGVTMVVELHVSFISFSLCIVSYPFPGYIGIWKLVLTVPKFFFCEGREIGS